MKSRSLRWGLNSPVAAEPNSSSLRTPNRRQRSTKAGCLSSIAEVMPGTSQSGYAILVRVHASCAVRSQIERKRRLRSSSKKFVELVVCPNPCPLDSIAAPFADDADVPTYSYRPIVGVTTQLFEFSELCPGFSRNKAKARRAALFRAASNSAYASQKLRVAREITCGSNRVAHCLRLSPFL